MHGTKVKSPDYLQIIRELETLCLRCGKCRSVCPSFSVRVDEVFSPRGRVALASALADGGIGFQHELIKSIDECLGCEACSAICPSGAAADLINVLTGFSITSHLGLPPFKRLMLRLILRHGRQLGTMAEWSSRIWALTLQEKPIKSRLRGILPLVKLDRRRHLPRPARKSFYHNLPAFLSARGGKKLGEIVFFPGCGLRLIYPQAALKTASLLSRLGFDVHLPRLETCCGRIALAHHDRETFSYLANKLQSRLMGVNLPIVAACGSCVLTLREVYPQLGFRGLPPISELSEVLAGLDVCWKAVDEVKTPITYHDPCHMRHGLGIVEQPRKLLRAAFGEQYREIDEAGSCCGAAGSYHLSHYTPAMELGLRKANSINQVGAKTVLTNCPACRMFLEEMAFLGGYDWNVRMLAEALTVE